MAVFARPRAIFVRKYVVEPGLRFVVVLGLVLLGRDATFVAAGYVLAAVAGLALYAVTFVGVLRARGLLAGFDRHQLEYPVRDYFGFSLPLVTTEVVDISFQAVTVALLGWSAGTTEVAGFKAVLPVARLNQLVIYTFTLLFTPMAARYFTRRDRSGMRDAYWRTAAWLAVGTFPMGVATVALADPITTTLFGERYADASPYLAILGGGFYVNAALGFNALTLQTWGRVRWVVTVNLASALLNVVLSVLLVPAHGAAGAAAAIATTLVVQNLLNQIGLGGGFGVGTFDRGYAGVYGTIAVAFAAVVAVQALLDPPLVIGLLVVAVASLVVLDRCRTSLAVEETFPELARIPVLGRLLVR
jgi:O-antigen/teichoic acid export membrane protein